MLLVHGIRDFALWQDEIRSTLEESGFAVEAINYGRFNLLQFLMPFKFFRRKAAETVSRQIRIVRQNNPHRAICVIAHSFGTYIVSHIMLRQFDVVFHRVIFCGSVVPYDFEFEQVQSRFTPPIVNEVGTRDIWPAIAESITRGYGSAGTYGFRRPLVRDRWHAGAKHSFFLKGQFCRTYWVPFLATGEVVRTPAADDSPSFWIRLLTIFKLKYAISALVLLVLAGTAVYSVPFLKSRLTGEPAAQQPALPESAEYCSDLKDVLAAADARFDPIVGRSIGDNKIPTVPLAGWEDCIIYMEGQFSNARSYSCKLPGFPDLSSASAASEQLGRDLTQKCLGGGYSMSKGRFSDDVPRWRIVGRGTRSDVTLRPWKTFSNQWEVRIDVQ